MARYGQSQGCSRNTVRMLRIVQRGELQRPVCSVQWPLLRRLNDRRLVRHGRQVLHGIVRRGLPVLRRRNAPMMLRRPSCLILVCAVTACSNNESSSDAD
jgi:hypothetical protein